MGMNREGWKGEKGRREEMRREGRGRVGGIRRGREGSQSNCYQRAERIKQANLQPE